MQAGTRTLKKLFEGDRQFNIPVYQRPYVWSRDRQWEPLWNDVAATARQFAQSLHNAGPDPHDLVKAEASARPHFLGAIVVEPIHTVVGGLERRSVVDGQQRLTTLQLLLRGVLDAVTKLPDAKTLKAKLRKLVRNDPDEYSDRDLLKVTPRRSDDKAYVTAIRTESSDLSHLGEEYSDTPFLAARTYFCKAAEDFIHDDREAGDPRAEAPNEGRAILLVSTLLGLLKLVVIDLEDMDDAQVIFEVLNARNTPLSAIDLVKNLLFMRAQQTGHDADELYRQVWARFDEDETWWRTPVGVGHATRPRQDWLVGDWMIAELRRTINVGQLYGEFRQWLDNADMDPVDTLRTMSRYADAQEVLEGRRPGASEREINCYRNIRFLNITAAMPVLLWLFTQPENANARDRELAVRAIESFVVRRMAMKWWTRGLPSAFAKVLKDAADASQTPGRAVIDALRAGPSGFTWPTDQQMIGGFKTGRHFGPGGIGQPRLRFLLGAVDRGLPDDLGEDMIVQYEKCQVEHILPQGWEEHWPVGNGLDENAKLLRKQKRAAHVHRIGNLTLVAPSLNKEMSNSAWPTKKKALWKHSHLALNKLLLKHEDWNEDRIVERSQWLAEHTCLAWPGPGDPVWDRSA